MKKYFPYILYATTVAAVMWPLFRPGYIFLTDMVFTPILHLPAIVNGQIPANYPIAILRQLLAFVLPAAVIQKIILSLILWLPAVFMYGLVEGRDSLMSGSSMSEEKEVEEASPMSGSQKSNAGESASDIRHSTRRTFDFWAFLAGLVYQLNPWVFERWLSGQWLVVMGYALFPLAVRWLVEAIEKPRRGAIIRFAVLFALYPIVSQHFAYFFLWFAVLFILVWWGMHRRTISRATIRKFFAVAALVVAFALLVNSFWLYNFFAPTSAPIGSLGATNYSSISNQDFKAYTTQADPVYGPYVTALALYGFWSTDYLLPKDGFPAWWVIALAFVAFAIFGAYQGFKRKEPLFMAAGIMFIPALVLGIGFAENFSMHVTELAIWLVPGFKGLRETEKLLGLVAFAYALLVPLGGKWLSEWIARQGAQLRWAPKAVGILIAVLVILSVNTIFGAFGGQVAASDYPASWYEAESIVESPMSKEEEVQMSNVQGPDVGSSPSGTFDFRHPDIGLAPKVLVLPWHAYLDLSFAGEHRVVNPATQFFYPQAIVGKGIDNGYVPVSMQDPWEDHLFQWVQGTGAFDNDLSFLRDEDVAYVLLLKESDWPRYGFVAESKHLTKVLDEPGLTLYRVK